MSNRLKKHSPVLYYLAKCKQPAANSIIQKAEPELIDCVSDICHNILKGNAKLSTTQKQKLSKYKQQIRKIANKTTTRRQKRKLIQKGGFLGTILAPLLGGLIGPLIKGLFPQQ